jgi:NADH-quinone oxidoreductase subunit N
MNLGAFGILIYLSRRGEEITRIDDLRGLYSRQPGAAALMAIFMLSLAGIPPTAGFMGKLFLFLGAVHAHLYTLAVVGVLASVIGVFYYLGVIRSMFFDEPKREFPTDLARFSPLAAVALAICAFFSLLFGIWPAGLYGAAQVGSGSLAVVVRPTPVTPVPPTTPAVAQNPPAVVP